MLIDLDRGTLDLNNPGVYPFTLEEVLTGLSRVLRFNGRTRNGKEPLNVFQHSCFVAMIASEEIGDISQDIPVEEEKAAIALIVASLLHDDHEYVVGDISTPVGRMLTGVPDLKARISGAIKSHILRGVDPDLIWRIYYNSTGEAVRVADNRALLFEAERLGFDTSIYPSVYTPAKIAVAAREQLKAFDAGQCATAWHPNTVLGTLNTVFNEYKELMK